MALPRTRARLQSSISIYAIKDLDIRSAAALAAAVVASTDGSQQQLVKIGAIKKIGIGQPRSINKWRQLDAEVDNPGEIQETYPSLPSYTLTIEKTVLYGENFLQAFGLTHGEDILEQTSPVLIAVVKKVPDNTYIGSKLIKPKTVFYTHVWFEDNPIEYDIENDDLRITQSISATFGRVITHPTG